MLTQSSQEGERTKSLALLCRFQSTAMPTRRPTSSLANGFGTRPPRVSSQE